MLQQRVTWLNLQAVATVAAPGRSVAPAVAPEKFGGGALSIGRNGECERRTLMKLGEMQLVSRLHFYILGLNGIFVILLYYILYYY